MNTDMRDHQGPVQMMMENLQLYGRNGVKPFSICRVPRPIRNVDEGAYEPRVVSIGPYHRRNSNLQAMEGVKWGYMDNLLRRRRLQSHADKPDVLWRCVDKVKGSAARISRCYEAPFETDSDDFATRLVLDGCFVVEMLLGRRHCDVPETADPVSVTPWMFDAIWRDLFILENQIPFFVLEDLFCVISAEPAADDHLQQQQQPAARGSFKDVACDRLREVLLLGQAVREREGVLPLLQEEDDEDRLLAAAASFGSQNPNIVVSSDQTELEIHHLLHLRHRLLQPAAGSADDDRVAVAPPQERRRFGIPCAVELGNAGIELRRKPEAASMLDVSFEDGVLHIPPLRIDDNTNSAFRNLTALEQCCRPIADAGGLYFTSYVSFLDCLVDTARDVAVLRRSGFVDNLLGSDEEVAELINRLGKDLSVEYQGYLEPVNAGVNRHCESKWHVYRAECMRRTSTAPGRLSPFSPPSLSSSCPRSKSSLLYSLTLSNEIKGYFEI